MRKTLLGASLICVLSCSAISAEPESITMTQRQFDQLFDELSNWGRWGKDDQRGTLNLITAETTRKATGLVMLGKSVSLALDLDKKKSAHNTHPFEHSAEAHAYGNQSIVSDKYTVEYHGAGHSHLDALSHIFHKGKAYNGFTADSLTSDGSNKLDIRLMKDGIVTRGVLVDMPWFWDVDFLDYDASIKISDLEKWEAKTGITIRSGDVLLVRTGRWDRDRKHGSKHLVEGAAGLHVSVVKWLKEREVAALGADGGNDALPSGVEGEHAPVHALTLVSLGMPLMDNLDLDDLAKEALNQGRWEFLFVAAPMRVQGGTGSPINPLAVF